MYNIYLRVYMVEPYIEQVRLATAVGSGASTVKHACDVGGLFGSEIFKTPGMNQRNTFVLSFGGWDCEGSTLAASILHPRAGERGLHAASQRHGLALPIELNYMQLSVCSDYTEAGDPVVEVIDWPFLQPHLREAWP